MSEKKKAYEIMRLMSSDKLAVTLTYIEYDRQLTNAMGKNDTESIERLSGLLEGLRVASSLLGVKGLYGDYVTPLRNAMQRERKEFEERND